MKLEIPRSIESKRLLIRPFKSKDYRGLYQLLSDKKSMEFSVLPGEKIDPLWCQNYINELQHSYLTDTPLFALAIFEKEKQQFIGTVGLQFFEDNFELYFVIISDFWNQGYGTETIETMSNYCENSLALKKLYSFVFPENQRSIKLLEKLQWKYVSTMPHPLYQKVGYLFSLNFI